MFRALGLATLLLTPVAIVAATEPQDLWLPTDVQRMTVAAADEARQGQRKKALDTLEQALALSPNDPEPLSVMALTLVLTNGEAPPTESDLARAGELAERAYRGSAGRTDILERCALVALMRGDLKAADVYARALAAAEPTFQRRWYASVVAAIAKGDTKLAGALLARARAAGLPDADYATLRAAIENAPAPPPGYSWHWALVVLAWWAFGAAALVAVGLALSALTLQSAARMSGSADARPSGAEASTRRAYRILLILAGAYYYVSMPVLLGLVIIGGGTWIYSLVDDGEYPVRVLVFVVVVGFITVSSILRSLIVRSVRGDPGQRIRTDEHRRLWTVLGEVAERVGTRTVDVVFLTPGTELAVFERGGFWRQSTGHGERCLILGIGALDGLRLGPFRAMLAHEYGHFSNRDTAGGGFALAVRRSALTLASNLAHSGASAWYVWLSPAWLFVNGFYWLFLRVSQGASRLQEVLADRWAVALYGAPAFEQGLRHVVDRSVRFNAQAAAVIRAAIAESRPSGNLYQSSAGSGVERAAIEQRIRQVLEAQPSPYDSHPRPIDRLRLAHEFGSRVPPMSNADEPVWDLLDDRTALEERMSAAVLHVVTRNRE